ncbi:MAG: hypothetical protein Q8S08_13690 [Halomonas sp.]|nr:hypothetical protein [Halomonas sp.]MDP3536430.1 hypothetical protein [Halomonas sp.]
MSRIEKNTRNTVVKRIQRMEEKMLERLEYLESSGVLSGDESAGVLMADLTAEMAEGYDKFHADPAFRSLRRF